MTRPTHSFYERLSFTNKPNGDSLLKVGTVDLIKMAPAGLQAQVPSSPSALEKDYAEALQWDFRRLPSNPVVPWDDEGNQPWEPLTLSNVAMEAVKGPWNITVSQSSSLLSLPLPTWKTEPGL